MEMPHSSPRNSRRAGFQFALPMLTLIPYPQAIIDGPSTGVDRQAIAYRYLVLTPHVIRTLPRAAGTSAVKKFFDKEGIAEKWASSPWAKKRQAKKARRNTTDCECYFYSSSFIARDNVC